MADSAAEAVYRFYGYGFHGNMLPRRGDENVGFVFVALAGNFREPVQQRSGKGPKSRLRIAEGKTVERFHQQRRRAVPQPAAEGNRPLKTAYAQQNGFRRCPYSIKQF